MYTLDTCQLDLSSDVPDNRGEEFLEVDHARVVLVREVEERFDPSAAQYLDMLLASICILAFALASLGSDRRGNPCSALQGYTHRTLHKPNA